MEARVSGRPLPVVQFTKFRAELHARIPRIRHLSLCAPSGHLYGALEGLVSHAPTLEYFSLFCRGLYARNKGLEVSISNTHFNGITPRLSCLKLRNCNISWMSPFLKGLKHLEIITPSVIGRPNLAVWLEALNEMPQLKTLALHSASPFAPSLPFDVERTVTLPSLTHLNISDSVNDCVLALAHLDLPTLTCLCVTVIFHHYTNSSGAQRVLPYVVRHAHGPQSIQPLRSATMAIT